MRSSRRAVLALFVCILISVLRTERAIGAEPGEEGAESTPSGLREVIIAFKTHFDIGYTDLAANVVERYRTTMIDQALEVVDRSRDLPSEERFVWTIPGWPLGKILEDWAGQTPDRKERIGRAFREGRFVVHALPFTTHTETLELEDLVRGMGFSSRLSREAGLPLPRDAKMTDVPCHSWVLPTLLRHAGVEFLHLGCNAASSSPRVPLLFWWEGPDGSRLLTMYSAAGYGTGLAPPEGWPHATWLALIHTGDNHGPPRPDEVRKLLDEAREKLPGVRVRIGRLSDFADAIFRERPDLPVVRGDMPDTWIHGPMCDPAGARIARGIRPAIAAAESLGAHLEAWVRDARSVGLPALGVREATATIAAAYEKSLLYGEHTWGGALYWVTEYAPGKVRFGYGDAFREDLEGGRFRRLEESWAEHTAYIESARDLAAPLLARDLETLAQAVNVEGDRVIVWNPLPWGREGLVGLPWSGKPVSALVPADGGEPSPAEVQGGNLRFFARDVPATGYRTYVPVNGLGEASARDAAPLLVDEATGTIESPHFRAVLDPARGAVRSLVAKASTQGATGRELVDANAPYGFGAYLYERFDAEQVRAYVKAYVKIAADWAQNELGKPPMPSAAEAPYRAASPRGGKLRLERTATTVSAVMESAAGEGIPSAVTTRLTLYRDEPFTDLEVTIHRKPPDSWPEAGWLCFPFRVETVAPTDRPRFALGRLSSIVDPAQDLVPGSNSDLFWVSGGVTVTDAEGRGAGLCPLDHGLVSLERPGCWRYSQDFVPKKPMVFVNLFNNQWTTNFRLWSSGTVVSRVRIWAVERHDPEASLVTPSWEARSPLLAARGAGRAGQLPPNGSGVEVSRRGVLVTAFGANPDGRGTVLRLWELAGRSGPCEVRLPVGLRPDRVEPVDLRGQPAGDPIPVREGYFTIPVRAFAPASVLLR